MTIFFLLFHNLQNMETKKKQPTEGVQGIVALASVNFISYRADGLQPLLLVSSLTAHVSSLYYFHWRSSRSGLVVLYGLISEFTSGVVTSRKFAVCVAESCVACLCFVFVVVSIYRSHIHKFWVWSDTPCCRW